MFINHSLEATDFSSFLNQVQSICQLTLKKEAVDLIYSYIMSQKPVWDHELGLSKKASIFVRHAESGLPFSIQYWKNGECLVYTKKVIGQGQFKKATLSMDLINKCLFVRLKWLNDSFTNPKDVIQEVSITDSFLGKKGIIQIHHSSYYPSKKNTNKMKFHIIQHLYSGTFDILWLRTLSTLEVKTMMDDLMHGLAAIHEKCLIHNDLKPSNILIQIDEKTNRVVSAVLSDLGLVTNIDDYSLKEVLKEQAFEVKYLLKLFRKLLSSHNMVIPNFIDNFSLESNNSEFITPAKKALEAISIY